MRRDFILSDRRRRSIRLALSALSAVVLGACGGGSGGGADINLPPIIEGKVSYDFVPTSATTNDDGISQGYLDYAKTTQLPVRHALVELVSANGGAILGTTSTDDSGAYSIAVRAGEQAYVRVTAQASEGPAGTPNYLIRVRDNTAPEYLAAPGTAPIYAMRGGVFTTASRFTVVNLNAGSGWTGAGYGAARTAAPFAILDQTVTAAQKLHQAAPDVPLPALNVFWSVNNRPDSDTSSNDADDDSSGNGSNNNAGLIETSHYEGRGAGTGLYILGAENVDTDEYDSSVIVHEYGHYVEGSVSRSDSVGGQHGSGNVLDMRVAFGEGFGNAFSSIMRGTPAYTDTAGPKQGRISVYLQLDRVPSYEEHAWYNESAVGNFIYEASQAASIGFTPMYRALLTGEKTTPAETSIFSFATALRPGLSDAGKQELDRLLAAVDVQGGAQLDEWGSQTSFPGDPADANPAVYPVYVRLAPGQTVTACTTNQFGTDNKLGNRRHLRVTIPAAGSYFFLATLKPGDTGVNDYYFYPFVMGQPLASVGGLYDFPAAGDYAVDVASNADLDPTTPAGTEPRCIDVTM
ncbi:hypothetical protein ACPRNU_24140 [Chromobacterium vaccinii]|uniref:hypothetical protein n=1 Tax=Chromobacterium vaccinii TaxID=1108595 RepID=UPI003C763649